MIIAIYILTGIFVLLFVYMSYVAQTERNEQREQMEKDTRIIELTSAGSDDENDSEGCHLHAKSVEVSSVDTTIYKDSEGNILDPNKYNLYIVDGNSMKLCGICDKDLIFSTRNFNIAEVEEFPIILVINKKHIKLDHPASKIRRTWDHVTFKDKHSLIEALKNVLKSENFQEIRILPEYPGDDEVLKDFEDVRLKRYIDEYINCDNPNDVDRDIVISSTLNTKKNVIHFSIHPVNKIAGEVIASFDMSNKQIHE